MAEFNVEFHSLPETFDLDFNGDQAFSLDMELPIVEVTPEDNVFVVTLSWDDDFLPEWADEPGAWVPDCTFAEIQSAYSAGKEVVCVSETGDLATCFYDGFIFGYVVMYQDQSDGEFYQAGFFLDSNGIQQFFKDHYIIPYFESISRTYTPSDQVQTETITYDSYGYGYNGIEEVNVTVNAAPAGDWEELDLYDQEFITENNQRKWQFKPGFLVDSAGWLAAGLRKGSYKKYNAVPANTTITPTTSPQTVGGAKYMMEGALTVAAMPTGTAGTPTATKGTVSNHAVTVTPSVTNTAGYISGGTKTGTAVSVSASELDSGTKSISSNGNNIDVVGYAAVDVAVSPTVDDLSITPSESAQTFQASSYNLDGFDEVNVSAVSADYVGSNIPRRYYADLTATGLTVSVPAGYYPNAVGKNVASGTAGTPTASKSAVSNHAVTVTPSVTNTTGYITGGTKTGTGVSVSASELVSGSETKTANGTYDVTNLAELVVNVSGGGGASMNVQVAAGVNRVNTTSYTAITGQSITVATTGTYDVYWTGYRSSTSGTNGTQLYVGDTAYGTAQTTFSNNGQSVHLTGVSLTKNQVITLRARARTTSYYMYGGNLTIVQTA